MMDIFERKIIEPMLIAENRPAFDSIDFLYELKLDGIRCIAYLDVSSTELRNKRNKRLNATFPELIGIHQQINARCILDGELLVLNNGKPNFFELQRRSLMSNPFKIELAAKELPVCFIAFDILYRGDRQLTDLPLTERKAILFDTINETSSLALSRYTEIEGLALFDICKEQRLEGIVAKRLDSKYYFGKRTKDWIKCKALLDEDFVVCGYFSNGGHVVSIILGAYREDRLVYQSHVSMGVSKRDFDLIALQKHVNQDAYADFPEHEGATWIEPVLVCSVQFMERTPGGSLRQPVFRSLRIDKMPRECVIPE